MRQEKNIFLPFMNKEQGLTVLNGGVHALMIYNTTAPKIYEGWNFFNGEVSIKVM